MEGRRRSAVRGALAVTFGAVAAGVGAGVGPPRVQSGDVGVAAVLGLGALVGGVALVVVGVVQLTRAVPRWWRLVTAPLTVIAVALGVYVIAVPVIVTTAPAPPPGTATPSEVGLAYEDVTIATTGDEALAGWYVPSAGRAAVIVLHGSGSSRSAVLEHAAVMARHGLGVLMLDARGHGASSGRAMRWGWYGDLDVPRAAAWLASRPDVDAARIAVLGLSMGGEEAIGAAALTQDIRAVVAEGATGRSADDLRWLSSAYGWRGTLTRTVHAAQTSLADLMSEPRRPAPLGDAVREVAPRPVLLIAAGRVPDEQHAAAALQASAPDSVQVWVVRGADHTGGLAAAPQEWESRVIDFLDAALADPHASR
ncbi:alpha/beta hydrolase [Cellulomonas gelida]|uniref:alpha/beta hydrolase n=1 Tax=Cellulomonas gelida TaxID=1712 RepID=UPI001144126F|nr:alpha/beta hydrolase [Cellulomonas gelida]